MARLLISLIFIVVMLIGVIIVRYSNEVYRTLPVDLETPKQELPFESWLDFTSAIGDFSARLPISPQHATEDLPVPDTDYVLKYDMYVAEEHDGTAYLISLIRYPDEVNPASSDVMLENVMNEMVNANPDNKLEFLLFNTFLGHRALDFDIRGPDVLIKSKGFVVERSLYLLTAIDKTSAFNEADYRYFIDSFKLIP